MTTEILINRMNRLGCAVAMATEIMRALYDYQEEDLKVLKSAFCHFDDDYAFLAEAERLRQMDKEPDCDDEKLDKQELSLYNRKIFKFFDEFMALSREITEEDGEAYYDVESFYCAVVAKLFYVSDDECGQKFAWLLGKEAGRLAKFVNAESVEDIVNLVPDELVDAFSMAFQEEQGCFSEKSSVSYQCILELIKQTNPN